MNRYMMIFCLMYATAMQSRAQSPDPFHFFPFENLTTETLIQGANTGTHGWDSTVKTDGNVSLHFTSAATAAQYGYQIYYDLMSGGNHIPQDITAYDYIGMDVYGDNSGATIYFQFSDVVANTVITLPVINWSGWKHLVFTKADLTPEYGTPAGLWPNVKRLQIVSTNQNGAAVDIYIDNVTATNTPPPPSDDNAMKVNAANRTIAIDGDPSDWDMTASQPTHIDVSARSTPQYQYNLEADIRYAWDADYLYILVQESGASNQSQEAGDAVAYSQSPWAYDGIALVLDLANRNTAKYSIEPWMGFSSAGLTGSWIGRKNNDDSTLLNDFLSNGAVATGGTFAQHNRVIEAGIKWTDIIASVDPAHLPAGGLASAIAEGFTFGCDPLLVENNWNGQSFIGGSQYTIPAGNESTAVDVVLSGELPVTLSKFWTEFD